MQMPISKIISKNEAQDIVESTGSLVIWTHHKTNEYFFSDIYNFPESMGEYTDDWVSCSARIPSKVTPRKGLESGIIKTVDDFLFIFHDDGKELDLS
jgi:hypothetical protein